MMHATSMNTLNIIGAGRAGRTLAALWRRRGVFDIQCVMNRTAAGTREAVAFIGAGGACERVQALQPASAMMEPLVRDTLDNVFKLGTMNALTGPIARGDHAVVARQLDALQAADAPLAEVYRALGVVAVELSRQQGGASEAALTIVRDLLQPPRNL